MHSEDNRPPSYYTYAYNNSPPTPEEIKATEELLEYIEQNGLYDTEEAANRRARVINRLFAMLKAWAVSIGTAKGVPDDILVDGGGIQIQIYGSTRLEVHNYSSDMDLLCIAPAFLTKADFFSSFCDTLSACPDVDNLLSIPEAYTPVIKFVMMGISIDLVFTALLLQKLNGTIDALDLRCLRGLDEQSVRSLNGVRVAEWLCKLVPNIKTFCVALRAIKHWAKQRGIYSNVLGFLGGVNFAILVAMICQQYQNATPFVLLQKFFGVYAVWPWPNPVILRRFEDLLFKDSDGRYLPVWNPLNNFKDSLHIMPIITPAYPSMNSAYNVALPQFRSIQEEFIRGNDIFQNHLTKTSFPWAKLFESSTEEFFTKLPRYIQIDVSAPNAMQHRKWFGWVESRVRLLILSLEQPPSIFCHPIANCFHRQPNQRLQHQNGGSSPSPLTNSTVSTENTTSILEDVVASNTDNSPNGVSIITPGQSSVESLPFTTPKKSSFESTDPNYSDSVFISSFFIGISFGAQTKVDLSPQINEFTDKAHNWLGYQPEMKLHIQVIDRDQIPAFIKHVKAEPSGMESCTPNISRYNSASVDNRSHPRSRDDDHARLAHHTPYHNGSRTEGQSFHNHTISFEAPGDDENGITITASRSGEPVPSVPTTNGLISNTSVNHLTTPTASQKPQSFNHTPRSSRSGSSNYSSFDTYRDVVVEPIAVAPKSMGTNGFYTNGHSNKPINSPKHQRHKMPQSPKSPISKIPLDQFHSVNGLMQQRVQRNNRNHHHNNNSHYNNGRENGPARRPSSGGFSSSSTEAEEVTATIPPSTIATTNANTNGIAHQSDLPPLKFGLLPPTAPLSGVQSSPIIIPAALSAMNMASIPAGFGYAPPIQPMRTGTSPHSEVNVLVDAARPERITPKRSRNELNSDSANQF